MRIPERPLPPTIEPPTVVAPSGEIFQRRADRLRRLATDSTGAEWLTWLADLTDAQQAACVAQPDYGLQLADDFDWSGAVFAGREQLFASAAPAAHEAIRRTLPASWPGLPDAAQVIAALPAARALLNGTATTGRRAPADIVAAAVLQVVWTAAAASLALPTSSLPLHERRVCPCCGSAPLGGIVLSGQGADGLRYLECALCATRWNAVRARCTLCDDPGVIGYLSIEGAFPAVRAEVCEHCRGYVKLYFQQKDIAVEPLADDLATLALDVLVGEQGYARGAPNPFLPDSEAIAA